ncbi:MAG: bifunctional homocysteine S-methyltransferase/methylenetetrahydrofolate reductase [Deltaproteobacteria bacterium]|nr:bifunctional homocysteine S-methyltransferase/methylenetetrahydrofolate reductase [Deltaproteobacteria bacterium]
MARRTLKQALEAESLVVFDGGLATEFYARHQFVNVCYDALCLHNPAMVKEIHELYRDAGAEVLTTNSFGANRFKLAEHLLADEVGHIARAAAEIAREVAGDDLLVAGSIGPSGRIFQDEPISDEDVFEAFCETVEGLKAGGADFLVFESFGTRREMLIAARAAAAFDMPYVPGMALRKRNTTIAGEDVDTFFAPFPEDIPPPTMLGFYGFGPERLLEELEPYIGRSPYPVFVCPNAGYPKVVSDRVLYMTNPAYFASYARRFVQLGVKAIGGSSGITPQHIKELVHGVKSQHRQRVVMSDAVAEGVHLVDPIPMEKTGNWGAKLARGEWVTSVELLPPRGWDLSNIVSKAAQCKAAGVDAINVPDGPRASCRVSPIQTCVAIRRDADIEPVLHVTCRDRNVIGIQSDLLGCAAAGVNNLLIVTGDPPKLGDYPFATAVFDIDSIGLTRIASRLNRGVDMGGQPVDPPTPFIIGVGADPTHLDQERELDRFRQKVEAGAQYAITQPVYDPAALLLFLERTKDLGIPIIAGIWPLASLRNAEFLNAEVPGVTVPDAILKRMAAAKTKDAARAEGVAIAREILAEVRDHIAGVQVSAPFGNVHTALAVLGDANDVE